MKRKLLLSLLAIGLIAALIGGATMAWFTDEAEVASAEFVAGTVSVNAQGPEIKLPENKFEDNVNPGDCATVEWNIINDGTKAAQLRVKLDASWIAAVNEMPEGEVVAFAASDLSLDNVFYAPKEGSGWTMYTDADEVWLYYTGNGDDGVPGTYGDTLDEDRTILLPLVIGFDGELTDNEYQGATFTIGGIVDAVQASNGAPDAVWDEIWSIVTAEEYAPSGLAKDFMDYFLTGAGKDMPCWTGQNPPVDPPADPYDVTAAIVVEGGGSVTGDGTYDEGAAVTLTAAAASGFEFTGWTSSDITIDDPSNTVLTFTMPAGDVLVTANFEAEYDPPTQYNLTAEAWKDSYYYGLSKAKDYGTVTPTSGTYNDGTTVTLTAKPNSCQYKVKRWDRLDGSTWTFVAGNRTTLNVTMDADKTYRVVFEKR